MNSTSTANNWRVFGQVFIGVALTVLFFYTMAPFMIALVVGAVIAILCEPIYLRLRKYLPPALAGLTVTGIVSTLILAPLTFVGISMVLRLADLLRTVKFPRLQDIQNIQENPAFIRLLHKIPSWIPINKDWIQEQGLAVLQRSVEMLSALVGAFIGELPGLLLGFVVVIVAAYFFIVDGKKFAEYLASISPLPGDKSRDLFNTFSTACRGVVLSMLAGSAAQGFLVFVFFAITGIPNALLWGFVGVIMGMIPLIGTGPISLGGIIYLFANQNNTGAIIVIVGAVVIGFSDNIVRPWVLKGHGEMHPLLGLVSAFGAVSVLGPMGIILGPIIAALFVSFLEILSSDLRVKLSVDGTMPPNTPPRAFT